LASQVLGVPVRTAGPEKLVGLVDHLKSPAYSTGFGLLHWAASLSEEDLLPGRTGGRHPSKKENPMDLGPVKDWLKRLLP
jgi:cell division ATPase FtsA